MSKIPELFMCPISLDLLSDPVILCTGQTYDRANIERWLAYGHRTCPVTMQRLHDTSLVANRTLKHLIDRWLLTVHPTVRTGLSEFSLPTLRENLLAPCISTATKVETLRIVRSLSPVLLQYGFCPLLVELLLQGHRRNSEEVVELALECVLELPSTELASSLHGALKKSSKLSSFVLLLSQGSVKVKTGLCHILETIATAVERESQELCLTLGQMDQVMRALVSLVHDKGNAAASEAALRAMSSLASLEANRATAVSAGAVDALITYISGPTKSRRVCLALETLELLLRLDTGRQAMYRNPNATVVLVKMVFRVPSDQGGSEHAVGSLFVACRESARVRVDAINAGLLTQLLLLLQSQCSPKAKANARALLKLLRAMWAQDGIGW